jgi:hypothetical protein
VSRNIRVSAAVEREPDVRLFLQVLLALARQLQREASADGTWDRQAQPGGDVECRETAK